MYTHISRTPMGLLSTLGNHKFGLAPNPASCTLPYDLPCICFAPTLCSKACKEMRESRVFLSRHCSCCLCRYHCQLCYYSFTSWHNNSGSDSRTCCLPSQFYLHVSFSVFIINLKPIIGIGVQFRGLQASRSDTGFDTALCAVRSQGKKLLSLSDRWL